MPNSILNKMYHSILANSLPSVAIQSYAALNDTTFAVTFVTDRKYKNPLLAEALQAVFAGAFTPVTDTLVVVPDKNKFIHKVIVKANIESHAYSDENVSKLGLHLTTANVFVDDSNLVWKLIGEGDSRRIVLTSTDDYAKILASKRANMLIQAALDTDLSFEFGDYVMFYNTASDQLDFGFAVNENDVLSRNSGKVEKVSAAALLEAAGYEEVNAMTKHMQLPGEAHNKILAGAKNHKEIFLDYWRKLYEGTPIYSKLEQMLKQSATW